MSERSFEIVGEQSDYEHGMAPQIQPPDTKGITDILSKMLSLEVLSKKFVIALANLFTLILVGSAFWLWMSIVPDPNPMQLGGAAAYSVFLLAIEYIRRK